MKNKSKNIIVLISLFVLFIVILWINGTIPKQIAKVSSNIYLKKNFPKIQLEFIDAEWSPSFGDYIIKFRDQNNELYSFCIGPKYFPVNLGQGLFALEEKYNNQNENVNSNNNDASPKTDNDTESTTFTKTYNILNIADSNDENYLYLTIRQFQMEEVKTVKVERSIANTVQERKNYEFTFKYTDNIVEDDIESIFTNMILLSIKETDKQGLDQIQDSIK